MRPIAQSTRSASALLLVGAVWLNALVRGGVDAPLLAVTALIATAALVLAHRSSGEERGEERIELPVLVPGLAAAVLGIVAQLVPLPPAILRLASPRAAALFEEALGPLSAFPTWRPISLDPGSTAGELARAAVFLAALVAATTLAASSRHRDTLLRGIAGAGAAVAAVYYGAAFLGAAPLVAPKVTFVNPNHLAGFLLLSGWTALGFALRARGAARVAWLAGFAFASSGVFLSLSRAGIAAFFVAAGVFVVLRMRAAERLPTSLPAPLPSRRRGAARVWAILRQRLRSRTLIAVAVSSALVIAAWLAFDPIVGELGTLSDARTTRVKLGMWPIALEVMRDFPLTGIGRGAFATVFPAYKLEPLPVTFTHVENEWLQLPLELGLVLGGGVVVLFAWAWVAAARRRDLSRPLAAALAGAAGLVAQSLFDFSLELPGVALPFGIVLGIAARDMPHLALSRRWLRAGAAALLLLAATGIGVHRVHGGEADASTVTSAATAEEAIARAREALAWHPADWVPPATVGIRLAEEGRCRDALPWLQRAMLRNPTGPDAHRAAGFCLAVHGARDVAKREYRLAFSYGDALALAEAAVLFPAPGELLEIAPDTPDGLLAAGRLLQDRPSDAVEAYRRAWEGFHGVGALGPLAQAQLALGDPEEALSTARLLQVEAPHAAVGYVSAARALDALDRRDDALDELERGAARLPGDAGVLVPLGQKHLAQRHFSQAKGVFEKIVARDARVLALRHQLVGRALGGMGRHGEALRELQAARDLAPGDRWVLAEFSAYAAAVGRFDEAIQALETASHLPGVPPGEYDDRVAQLRTARAEQAVRRAAQGLQ